MPINLAPHEKAILSGYGTDSGLIVSLVKHRLLSREDRELLDRLNLTVFKVLNGDIKDEDEKEILAMFDRWNDKLGWKQFSY